MDPHSTLQSVQDHVWKESQTKQGVVCPACRHHTTMRKRPLNCTKVRFVIWLLHQFQQTKDWVDVREAVVVLPEWMVRDHKDYLKVTYWGLVETKMSTVVDVKGDEGRQNIGFVKPSMTAVSFIQGKLALPKYVYVMQKNVWFFKNPAHPEIEPETVFVGEALESRGFDYAKETAGLRWNELI